MKYIHTKIRVEFKGICFKQDEISFNHGKVVNIYIIYEINKEFNISSHPTLENCSFGASKLTKHPDIDQYKYSGYGMGYDRKGFFSLGDGIGRHLIVFGIYQFISTYW